MQGRKLNWLLSSRAYTKARDLVNATIRSPERLSSLISDAQHKLGRYKNNTLSSVTQPISTAIRLIKAYTSGEYREIPFESLALIVASIIYFVMPLDVVPDFILALGYTDDIALLTWTFRTVKEELKKFVVWEESKSSTSEIETNILEHKNDDS